MINGCLGGPLENSHRVWKVSGSLENSHRVWKVSGSNEKLAPVASLIYHLRPRTLEAGLPSVSLK